jgi:hypothetical protein
LSRFRWAQNANGVFCLRCGCKSFECSARRLFQIPLAKQTNERTRIDPFGWHHLINQSSFRIPFSPQAEYKNHFRDLIGKGIIRRNKWKLKINEVEKEFGIRRPKLHLRPTEIELFCVARRPISSARLFSFLGASIGSKSRSQRPKLRFRIPLPRGRKLTHENPELCALQTGRLIYAKETVDKQPLYISSGELKF